MCTDIFDYKTQTKTTCVLSFKDALNNSSVMTSSIVMLKHESAL